MQQKEVIAEIQKNLLLQPSLAGGCFGAVGGVPVHFLPTQKAGKIAGKQQTVGLLLWLPRPEAGEAFVSALRGDPELSASGFDPKAVSRDGGALLYAFPVGFLGGAKIAEITRLSAGLLKTWKAHFEGDLTAAQGKKTALVNGLPTMISDAELAEIRTIGSKLQEAYGQIPIHRAAGLAGAALAAILGAVVWGLIGAYANLQAWIVAIGIGWAVAWAAVKLAKRPDKAIRAAVFVFTVLSVILGQILTLAFLVQKEHGVFPDLLQVTQVYFGLLSEGDLLGDFLFAAGGGVVGAWYAIQKLAPPAFEPQIET